MTNINKAIVFDIWSDHAHFRRGYTTTSPLTYPFPTRTALAGIVAAILGLEIDNHYDFFRKDNSAFALQIINPIKKIKITENLIDTKIGFYLWDCKGQRTQIIFEYLKDPKYRVYLWLKEKFEEFSQLIKEHKSIYTPYLGISKCVMNFNYIGIFDVEHKSTNGHPVEISSIVKDSKGIEYDFEEGKKYGRVKMPGFMDPNRKIIEFLNIIYEENGKTIKIRKGEYYKVMGYNVIFF
jgi:CRISPR-associated protein Cas5h